MDPEEKEYLDTKGGEIEAPKKEEIKAEVAEEKAPEVEEFEEETSTVDVPHVPYSRFKEVLQKRKEDRERTAEIERRAAMLEGELKALKEAATKPPEPVKEERPVDWDQDPKAAHEYVTKQAAELKARLEAQEKQTRHREAHDRFMNDYRAKVAEHVAKAPEFPEAYNFLFESRVKEHQAAGLDSAQAHARTLQEEEQTVLHALMNNKNPGEVLHEIAKVRGFKPKAKTENKIETVNRGKGIDTSIGNGTGGGTSTPTTLEALADMPSEDFNKVLSNENARRKFWEKHGGG